MPRLDAGRAAVKYPPHSPLREALQQRVQEYFKQRGIGEQGGHRMWVKSATILVWWIASYLLLVFWAQTWWQAVPLAVSLGFAVAGIGFNIQHDGGHGAFSRRRLGNRLTARSLDLVGGSSYFWHFKHNLIHHHYTNIEGVDDDLDSEPFLRMTPGQPRRWYHRFQHYYVWALLAFFPAKWAFFDDFHSLITGRVGSERIPRPRGRDLVVLVGGKLAYAGWVLVLPLIFHPWQNVLGLYAVAATTLGITLATTFQLAHCVEGAKFSDRPEGDGRMESSWVEHQLETTVDFAPNSRWLTWYLGGLNFQVEHHLFPRISHIHYPALASITREVCREFGIKHQTHRTLWAALRAHLRWMRRMGRAPVAA